MVWLCSRGAQVKCQALWSFRHQFSSVAQSCLTLCDPMDCSTPGLPVHHQLLEFAQTHGHRVSDAIQPSHPLSSLSPPAFTLPFSHSGILKPCILISCLSNIIKLSVSADFFVSYLPPSAPALWVLRNIPDTTVGKYLKETSAVKCGLTSW